MSKTSTTGAYVYQQIVRTTAEWAADTSVIPENVWLFERRKDGKIVTKLSDGLHPYNKLEEYGLSAWDAAILGGYKGTREEFYKSLGLMDKRFGEVTDLVSSLSGKYAETPTLPSTPTEDTLTYMSGDVRRDFSIGQQCRVYEEEEGDFVFYQLYHISGKRKADWRIAGSGGGSAFFERAFIALSSNQEEDDELIGKKITVAYPGKTVELVWNGKAQIVNIPLSVEYTVTPESIDGYASPKSQSYVATGGNIRQIDLTYSCEKVIIKVMTNDHTDCSGQTVTVRESGGSRVITQGKGEMFVVKIPLGIAYTVSVDKLKGYFIKTEQSFVANSAVRPIVFEYAKIIDASIVFDRSISDPANITGDVNSGVIASILSKFRRCLCKKTAEGEVTICYVRDNDSNYYEDGATARLDGGDGDVMVNFPEFYYKHEKIDENRFRYRFAEYNPDGTFIHVPRSLVGAYKAYQSDGKLYSRSGVKPAFGLPYQSVVNSTMARGSGYQNIDFQQHCVIAFMLFAKYGTRDLQAVLGRGGDGFYLTGMSNPQGINDSFQSEDGYVNGLGLEGVFGVLCEWVCGIEYEYKNGVWTVTDPDGKQRSVKHFTGTFQYGWVKEIAAESGPYFDAIGTLGGGSSSTYYADRYYEESDKGTAMIRSGAGRQTDYGVIYARRISMESTGGGISSRLAFRGIIHEESDTNAFRALPLL